jgi:hypothetical protein
MSEFVSSTFRDREEATAAVDRLVANGYGVGDITVVMSRRWRETYFGAEPAGRGPAADTKLDGLIGRASPAQSGARNGRDEGAQAMFVAGPLASALGGQNADRSMGNVMGTLFGKNSQTEQREIESDLERGAIVVAVSARNADVDEARRILHTDAGRQRREAAPIT